MLTCTPHSFAHACADAEAWWTAAQGTARLFARDATLWTAADESQWLGWLDLTDLEPASVQALRTQLAPVRRLPAEAVVLLGMGGSSLGAEVMARVLPRGPDGLPLHVVDTLHPDAVLDRFDALRWDRTLVIAASKSGGTLEPAVLLALARQRLTAACGEAGLRRIIAITDPGSALDREAQQDGFGAIVHGRPTVGGRFSMLSPFGLVPALLLDAPIEALRHALLALRLAVRDERQLHDAQRLGLAIATAAMQGRDKLIVHLPRALGPLGAWIEQLVAESLGKRGRVVLPVVDEPSVAAVRGGNDRLHLRVGLSGDPRDGAGDAAGSDDAAPSVGWTVAGVEALWAECFRWEIATAVAAARLGLNPFDQPDVEASKIATKALSAAWEHDGVPPEAPSVRMPPHDASDVAELLAWRRAVRPGDYVGLLVWLPMSDAMVEAVQQLRAGLAETTAVATVVGFGPRYLHSTGQAFKGGPNTGCFVSVAAAPTRDVEVPGRTLSLGTIARAQREGELAVLRERGRRVIDVSLVGDPLEALRALTDALRST